jgi:hypothetical protein
MCDEDDRIGRPGFGYGEAVMSTWWAGIWFALVLLAQVSRLWRAAPDGTDSPPVRVEPQWKWACCAPPVDRPDERFVTVPALPRRLCAMSAAAAPELIEARARPQERQEVAGRYPAELLAVSRTASAFVLRDAGEFAGVALPGAVRYPLALRGQRLTAEPLEPTGGVRRLVAAPGGPPGCFALAEAAPLDPALHYLWAQPADTELPHRTLVVLQVETPAASRFPPVAPRPLAHQGRWCVGNPYFLPPTPPPLHLWYRFRVTALRPASSPTSRVSTQLLLPAGVGPRRVEVQVLGIEGPVHGYPPFDLELPDGPLVAGAVLDERIIALASLAVGLLCLLRRTRRARQGQRPRSVAPRP